MYSILSKIKSIDFPKHLYIPKVHDKTQVVLHHTVSPNDSIRGDLYTWLKDQRRIATCIIVGGDGTPNQLFSSRYSAYHLGIKEKVFRDLNIPYKFLDFNAIGVEIDTAGGLVKRNGAWYDVYGYKYDSCDVQEYEIGYRGFYGFQKYTDAQIETVRQLLIYWNDFYGIPLTYNDDMWVVSKRALTGTPGIWSHTSYRKDKSDIHPQPEMVEMLQSLTK